MYLANVYNKISIANEADLEKYIIKNTPKLSRNYYKNTLHSLEAEKRELEKNSSNTINNKQKLETFKSNSKEYKALVSKIESIEKEKKKKIVKEYNETYNKIDFILHIFDKKKLVMNCDKKYPSLKKKKDCISFSNEIGDIAYSASNKKVTEYLNKNIDTPTNWKSEFIQIFDSRIKEKFDGNLNLSSLKLFKSNIPINFSILLALQNSLSLDNSIISNNGTIFQNMSNGIMAIIKFFKHSERGEIEFYFRMFGHQENNNSLYETNGYLTIINFTEFYVIKNMNYYIDISFSASPFLLNTNSALIASTSIVPIIVDEKRLEELY